MAICVLCDDTGKVAASYCVCTIGQVQKRVARGAARAEELKEKEKKQKTEKAKLSEQVALFPEESKKERDPFELYDWVEIARGGFAGRYCLVLDVDKKARRIFIQGEGLRSWAMYSDVKLAAISKRDINDCHSLMHVAVDSDDREWFNELKREMATIK